MRARARLAGIRRGASAARQGRGRLHEARRPAGVCFLLDLCNLSLDRLMPMLQTRHSGSPRRTTDVQMSLRVGLRQLPLRFSSAQRGRSLQEDVPR